MGRWINRDPLGEEQFFSLYSSKMQQQAVFKLKVESLKPSYQFVSNDPINYYDIKGLWRPLDAVWDFRLPGTGRSPFEREFRSLYEEYTAKAKCVTCHVSCTAETLGLSWVQDAIVRYDIKRMGIKLGKKGVKFAGKIATPVYNLYSTGQTFYDITVKCTAECWKKE